MSYLFYGINSAIKYARDGYSKELSDFLSKKPHLINAKNKNGNSILHIACWKGDADMVLMLLMRGANVNITDSKGYSPLLVAIEFGHDALAMCLLERGADVTVANQAECLPLHVAALTGCKDMIVPLLERGADINATETNGCTPLLCALRGKHSEVAIILIDKGADLTARDRDDWLPIGLAKMNGLTAVVAAIALRFEYQNLTMSRSSSSRDVTPDRQRMSLIGPPLKIEQRVSPEDDIMVIRSQSQPALVHTMTASSSASVTSASVMSKTSKGSKSGKKKRKERRASVSEMSTIATTAAIEAVTKAMQECGGDVTKAALLLIQQQQQQPRMRDGTKRRSSKKEVMSDEFSVSVISEGTTASKAKISSAKKRASLGEYPEKIDDDECSVQSGSTRGSRSSRTGGKSRDRRTSSADDENTPLDGARRGRLDRGGSLMPIEEEIVIRKGSRVNGSPSRRGRGSAGDDVDSDGETFGPPAIFCFWNTPVKPKAPPRNVNISTALASNKQSSKGACVVM